jgi:hypothetical protein
MLQVDAMVCYDASQLKKLTSIPTTVTGHVVAVHTVRRHTGASIRIVAAVPANTESISNRVPGKPIINRHYATHDPSSNCTFYCVPPG